MTDYNNDDYGAAFGESDWDSTETTSAFEPLPVGWYKMAIFLADMKKTAKGGDMVVVTLEVVPGADHAGRKVTDYQCINLPYSPIGERLGRAAHKQLCVAAGFDSRPSSLRDLEGKIVEARLKIETDPSGQYDPSNRVAQYRAPVGKAPAPDSYGALVDGKTDLPF